MPLIEESHDSLPYIDPDLTPTARAQATALITSELPPAHTTTLHPSLPALPTPHFTPPIETEIARHAAHLPLTGGIDTTRYEALEPPPATTPTSDSDHPQILEAWRSTLTKAYTSSTHLQTRLMNLALLEQFGKNAWLISNSQLEQILGALEKEIVESRAEIEGVNKARKVAQEGVRGEMEGLEGKWREGVGRVLEVEVAAEGVRREVLVRRRAGAV
ncbi:MAG: hypothetical protein M1830_007147 [Pleopsidium flavum]|nr:MAG: hypothetical protein M1830_007147 [Pleopsidium flavum]